MSFACGEMNVSVDLVISDYQESPERYWICTKSARDDWHVSYRGVYQVFSVYPW
jgi:hypothetical protein